MTRSQQPDSLHDVNGGVLVPVGFEPDDRAAFEHALRIALALRSSLVVLTAPGADPDTYGIRDTLERWGLLEAESARDEVAGLGVWVGKARSRHTGLRAAVLGFLEERAVDLVVVPVHGAAGVERLLRLDPPEPHVPEAETPVLYVRADTRSLLHGDDGHPELRRILVPVAPSPSPVPATRYAKSLVRNLVGSDGASGEFRLLHAGNPAARPELDPVEHPGWTTTERDRAESPVEAIVAEAREWPADVVVMTTDGPEGLFEALRGSTTERVIHEAPCPVLAVPDRR